MKMRNLQSLSVFALALLAIACGGETEEPIIQYMPHMANTPVLKAQRGYDGFKNGASVLMPPEGTIARGFKPYHLESADIAEQKLTNPFPANRATLERGKKMFGVFCYPCHGPKGYGDGPVVPPFPMPKSLQSENMRKWKDGHIFHVITMGQAVMPSYAQQVSEADRWAIIHYVRALQRAENPSAEDVKIFKSKKVN